MIKKLFIFTVCITLIFSNSYSITYNSEPKIFISELVNDAIKIYEKIASYKIKDIVNFVLQEWIDIKKKNTYIGIGTVIKHGVGIGKNTVIGGNSFVNKKCLNNSLYFGTPVKKIKSRKKNSKYL